MTHELAAVCGSDHGLKTIHHISIASIGVFDPLRCMKTEDTEIDQRAPIRTEREKLAVFDPASSI